jgi:hypothetical protein
VLGGYYDSEQTHDGYQGVITIMGSKLVGNQITAHKITGFSK